MWCNVCGVKSVWCGAMHNVANIWCDLKCGVAENMECDVMWYVNVKWGATRDVPVP